MEKKIYYLKSCSTCTRIIKELEIDATFELREIKSMPVTERELEHLAGLAGSYEKLFSRKSQKFRLMDLQVKMLNEDDYRQLILKEYTFLKRPVVLLGTQVFIGNSKESVMAAKAAILS